MRCLSDCTLVYISGSEITKRWSEMQIEELKKNMRILDLDYIVSKIDRYSKEKTKRNDALLDGSKLNCHDFSGARSQFLQANN